MRFMLTSLMELGRRTTRSIAAGQTLRTNKSCATDLHGFTRIRHRNLVLIRGGPRQSVVTELSARRARRPIGHPRWRYLILREFLHRKEQIVGLGENCIFQNGLVGDEHVFGGHAANGGVELVEKPGGEGGPKP